MDDVSERAAIVKWLRNLTPEQLGWSYFGDLDEDTLGGIADAIERLEHRKDGGNG